MLTWHTRKMQQISQQNQARKTCSQTCAHILDLDHDPISFTLVIDDFRIKYVGKEHALHLLNILKEHSKISEDWSGTKFIRLTFAHAFSISHQHECRTHHTTMFLPHMAQQRNLLCRKCRAPYLTKQTKHMCRPSLARCCIMPELLILQSSQRSMQLQCSKQHQQCKRH